MNDNAILMILGAVILLALIIPSIDASKIILEGGGAGFCQILAYGNDTILCNGENSTATFVGGTNISLTAFPLNDTIRIDGTGGAGGEANTASNVGTGSGWFKQKTGVDLEFLSILGENGIIITPNTDDLTLGLSDIPKSAISATGTFAESDIPTLSKSKISAVGTFSWTEISKSGSSIHDISNVTSSGCAINEILKVNSTGYFDCSADQTGGSIALDDLTDVIITSPAYLSTLFYDGANWIDKIFSIDSKTCSAGQFVSAVNNQTGAVTCSTPTGSGNATSLNDLGDVVLTSPAYPSILFYDGLQWIDKIFSINTQSAANDFQIVGINNQTGEITRNQFSVNTITCSGTDKISAIDNSTGAVTCSTDETGSGGGITTLGSDVTCTSVSPNYCTVFTIPLTVSSGNSIHIQLVADSNTAGVAIQTRARGDDGQASGFCVHRVYTSTTAETLDVLTVTGTPADTGETNWTPQGANVPTVLTIDCAVQADASSPQNLIVDIQMEGAATGTIQKGSHYIKTP